MVPILSLAVPILVSAVLVFVASSSSPWSCRTIGTTSGGSRTKMRCWRPGAASTFRRAITPPRIRGHPPA